MGPGAATDFEDLLAGDRIQIDFSDRQMLHVVQHRNELCEQLIELFTRHLIEAALEIIVKLLVKIAPESLNLGLEAAGRHSKRQNAIDTLVLSAAFFAKDFRIRNF